MLEKEALWLRVAIEQQKNDAIFPLLNLGSSTADFRARVQPWIDREIFRPLSSGGNEVVHTDIKDEPGVDLVGDLTDPVFRQRLKQKGFKSVLCSNFFEHVENRNEIAVAVVSLLSPGCVIFASCPKSYPYHPDPIDNSFRPDVDELAKLFPNTSLIAGDVIESGSFPDRFHGRPLALLQYALRILMPFYRFNSWRVLAGYAPYFRKHFETTCIVLRVN